MLFHFKKRAANRLSKRKVRETITKALKNSRRTGTQMWGREVPWLIAKETPAMLNRKTNIIKIITATHIDSELYQGTMTFLNEGLGSSRIIRFVR